VSRADRSVALTDALDGAARRHLIRADGQEDICFALWRSSRGRSRHTGLLYRLILPEDGDRAVHGNASFNGCYFERALGEAVVEGAGLALLHSHPHPGWQDMSRDDVAAEHGLAAATSAATGMPLLGLTIGSDGAWSARFWGRVRPREYDSHWCATVRVVGERLAITYHDKLAPPPPARDELRRTISAWGPAAQAHLARVRVGLVGAGSVGAIIGEGVARTGIEDMMVLDFDRVERHNLDRLLHASRLDADRRRLKAELLATHLREHATAEPFRVEEIIAGVDEPEGYRAALDCDVLISCVDRPSARHVLNYIAYAHLIPVVDGGILVRSSRRGLLGADWRSHVAAPGRRCLACARQYDPGLVEVERKGLLDDPRYIESLPEDHPLRRNENVFCFSLGCAAQQFWQMLALITAPQGISNLGTQMYHAVTGHMEEAEFKDCGSECFMPGLAASGDAAGIDVTWPRRAWPVDGDNSELA
jgi:hypothetical protein